MDWGRLQDSPAEHVMVVQVMHCKASMLSTNTCLLVSAPYFSKSLWCDLQKWPPATPSRSIPGAGRAGGMVPGPRSHAEGQPRAAGAPRGPRRLGLQKAQSAAGGLAGPGFGLFGPRCIYFFRLLKNMFIIINIFPCWFFNYWKCLCLA